MSWAGVIFRAPVPNSRSTYSSMMMGTARPTPGTMTRLPRSQEYRSSSGWTQTAVSPMMVSGRVVATTI